MTALFSETTLSHYYFNERKSGFGLRKKSMQGVERKIVLEFLLIRFYRAYCHSTKKTNVFRAGFLLDKQAVLFVVKFI